MPIPPFHEMHRPTLKFLADGDVKNTKEIDAYIKIYFGLTEDDLSEMLPSGRQTTFKNRSGWSRTYLKKAGLIASPKIANFKITEEGKKVIQTGPEIINNAYLMKYDSFQSFSRSNSSEEPNGSGNNSPANNVNVTDDTPDDQFEFAFTTIRRNLESDILDEVMKLTPRAFEQFALDLLGHIGYGAFENGRQVTQYSGDEGIDGVIKEDKLGFSLIYVQAKQWATDRVVSNSDIRNFVGALAGKDGKGLFITTAKFSKHARDLAQTHNIVLIDGDKLAELMVDHNFGVSVEKTFEIKEIDSDAFDKYETVE